MLVVFARPDDPAGSALAAAWPGETAFVTPRDLSRPGWHLAVARPGEARLVADGRPIDVAAVAGVISRTGWIMAHDLPWIDGEDRDYVAAEMSAFLFAFLDQLPCPVLNRPTCNCLAGPVLRPAGWRAAATQAGLTLAALSAVVDRQISVIGDACFGAPEPDVVRSAVALARACGAALLALQVEGPEEAPRFVSAHPLPDLAQPALAAAAVALVRAGGAP